MNHDVYYHFKCQSHNCDEIVIGDQNEDSHNINVMITYTFSIVFITEPRMIDTFLST